MFKRKRRHDMRGQWVKASEINRIIEENPPAEGKTTVLLIGANVIRDCEIYFDAENRTLKIGDDKWILNSEKVKVVVAHCTFCE